MPWKFHRRTALLSWQTVHMTSMSKWSSQQLLKLLLLLSNRITEVSVSMPSSTTRSVFQCQASGESSNEDIKHVPGQLLLVPLSWKDLIGNAGSGRMVTCREALTEAVAWPQTRCMMERCAQAWPHAAKCKDQGVEDYDQLSLPRNSCGKGCACRYA